MMRFAINRVLLILAVNGVLSTVAVATGPDTVPDTMGVCWPEFGKRIMAGHIISRDYPSGQPLSPEKRAFCDSLKDYMAARHLESTSEVWARTEHFARQAIERAYALGRESRAAISEGHLALIWSLVNRGDLRSARQQLEYIEQTEPVFGYTHMLLNVELGRCDTALAQWQQAQNRYRRWVDGSKIPIRRGQNGQCLIERKGRVQAAFFLPSFWVSYGAHRYRDITSRAVPKVQNRISYIVFENNDSSYYPGLGENAYYLKDLKEHLCNVKGKSGLDNSLEEWQLVGHADQTCPPGTRFGDDECDRYNQTLSENRARNIAKTLRADPKDKLCRDEQPVPPVPVVGKGYHSPLHDRPGESVATNRRVELLPVATTRQPVASCPWEMLVIPNRQGETGAMLKSGATPFAVNRQAVYQLIYRGGDSRLTHFYPFSLIPGHYSDLAVTQGGAARSDLLRDLPFGRLPNKAPAQGKEFVFKVNQTGAKREDIVIFNTTSASQRLRDVQALDRSRNTREDSTYTPTDRLNATDGQALLSINTQYRNVNSGSGRILLQMLRSQTQASGSGAHERQNRENARESPDTIAPAPTTDPEQREQPANPVPVQTGEVVLCRFSLAII